MEKEAWLKAQENGMNIINQLYSKRKLEMRFLNAIETQFENLTQLRDPY